MKIQAIASFAIVAPNPVESRKLFVDGLALPLKKQEDEDYYFSEQIAGSNHFGVWPLSRAAQACFGTNEWPSGRPAPQASIEFEVENTRDVETAGRELEMRGFTLLHRMRTEPWGQTIVRVLSPEGVIVGVSYTPWLRDRGSSTSLAISAVLAVAMMTWTGCEREPDAATIHGYAAPSLHSEGSVNSWWIETAHSVVVIDGLRTIPDARGALAELEKLGKPIEALFVTHPHPDHIGGLGVFAQAWPNAPIYATSVTDNEIASDPQGLIGLARSFEGPAFPDVMTRPTDLVSDGDRLTVDGVEFVVHDRGPSESVAATSIECPSLDAWFEGDVVANQMTVALIEGRSEAWLHQLEALQTTMPSAAIIYPGHGDPGPGQALVEAQEKYLTTLRRLIMENRLLEGTVDAAGKARIRSALDQSFPNHPNVAHNFSGLLDANIDAVAEELSMM